MGSDKAVDDLHRRRDTETVLRLARQLAAKDAEIERLKAALNGPGQVEYGRRAALEEAKQLAIDFAAKQHEPDMPLVAKARSNAAMEIASAIRRLQETPDGN